MHGALRLAFLALLILASTTGCERRTTGGGSPGSIAGGGFTAWSKTFGGDGADRARAVVQSPAGHFFILGTTNSFGLEQEDLWLVRADEAGDSIWSRTIASTTFDANRLNDAARDGVGGYVIVGQRTIPATGPADFDDDDAVVTRIDSSGVIRWQRSFTGPESVQANAVIRNQAGDFVVVGRSSANGWVAILSADGELLSEWLYNDQRFRAVAQTPDGGYIVGGGRREGPIDPFRAYCVKVGANGAVEWDYDGPEPEQSGIDTVHSWVDFVEARADGGIVATGTRADSAILGEHHCFFAIFEADGDVTQDATIDTPEWIFYRFLRPAPDGGYIATGVFDEAFGYRKVVHKVTDDFVLEWDRDFFYGNPRVGDRIYITDEGNYYILGHRLTNRDTSLTLLDPMGETIGQAAHRFDDEFARGYGGVITPDGGFLLVGATSEGIDPGDRGEWVRLLPPPGEFPTWDITPVQGRDDRVGGIVATGEDGGCLIAGSVGEGDGATGYVVRVNQDGGIDWKRSYAGLAEVYAIAATETGFAVVGRSPNGGAVIATFEADGTPIAAPQAYADSISGGSIRAISDGEYVAAFTYTDPFGPDTDQDVIVLRFVETFTTGWGRLLNTSNPTTVAGVVPCDDDLDGVPDGGFYVGGTTIAIAGGTDFWVMRLSDDGDIEWERQYGGPDLETAAGVVEALGGVVVGGTTSSFEGDEACGEDCPNLWMVQVSSTGDLVWERSYSTGTVDRAHTVARAAGGGYVIAGETDSIQANPDYWVIRVDEDGVVAGSCVDSIGAATFSQHSDIAYTEATPVGFFPEEDGLESRLHRVGARGALGFLETRQCSGVVVEPTAVLTIEVVGPGFVVGIDPVLECAGTCTFEFPTGTAVALNAVPNGGATFVGWEGDTTDGTLTLDGDRLVRAVFQAGTGCTGDPVFLTEGDFGDAWIQTIIEASVAAEGFGYTMPTGGNPGAFWTLYTTLPPGGSHTSAYFDPAHGYDPATQGAIATIEYREDVRTEEPLPADVQVEVSLAARQGGRVFILAPAFRPAVVWSGAFTPVAVTGITAASFLPTEGVQPDFSATGAPITFGFARIVTTTAAAQVEAFHSVDNWSVEVRPVCE